MGVIHITPSEKVLSQERTCRYGHGPLVQVEKVKGQRLFIVMAYALTDVAMDRPRHIGPLQWHLCKECGYMEVVDITPLATLALMEAKDE